MLVQAREEVQALVQPHANPAVVAATANPATGLVPGQAQVKVPVLVQPLVG